MWLDAKCENLNPNVFMYCVAFSLPLSLSLSYSLYHLVFRDLFGQL